MLAVTVPLTASSGIFVGGIGIPFCCSTTEGIEVFDMLAAEDEDEGWEGRPPLDGRAGICVSEADISVLGEAYRVLKGSESTAMYEQ